MRKTIVLLLSMLMLVFSVMGLVACSEKDEPSDESQSISGGSQSISGSQSSTDVVPE